MFCGNVPLSTTVQSFRKDAMVEDASSECFWFDGKEVGVDQIEDEVEL